MSINSALCERGKNNLQNDKYLSKEILEGKKGEFILRHYMSKDSPLSKRALQTGASGTQLIKKLTSPQEVSKTEWT